MARCLSIGALVRRYVGLNCEILNECEISGTVSILSTIGTKRQSRSAASSRPAFACSALCTVCIHFPYVGQ